MSKPDLSRVADAFRKSLDSHGYGFQYAVLKEAGRLCETEGSSGWFPLLPELPVAVRSHDTRIDLVFEHVHHPRLLVVECKRANPATANWCFAGTPWQQPPFVASRSFVEVLSRPSEGRCYSILRYLGPTTGTYQVALEVRTGDKGDSGGKGRGEIEEAAGQVSKGLNGLIELLNRRDDLLSTGQALEFIPAIITTARLFVTDADLGQASLSDGKLPVGEFSIEEKDWLWYDYPQSPGIKHSVETKGSSDDLRNLLFDSYVRRIAVVAARGLEAFLTAGIWKAPTFAD